jgi:hypothetical protein
LQLGGDESLGWKENQLQVRWHSCLIGGQLQGRSEGRMSQDCSVTTATVETI